MDTCEKRKDLTSENEIDQDFTHTEEKTEHKKQFHREGEDKEKIHDKTEEGSIGKVHPSKGSCIDKSKDIKIHTNERREMVHEKRDQYPEIRNPRDNIHPQGKQKKH